MVLRIKQSPAMIMSDCDYELNPTSLYQLIEEREWDDVRARADFFPEEAKRFIVRHESSTNHLIKWRLLPIHAAILLSAPASVIQALLEAYPEGAQLCDDETNLPIHLAVKKHVNEETLNLLLHAFPDSINLCNGEGLTPFEMATKSNSPYKKYYLRALRKGKIHSTVTANIVNELLCGVNLSALKQMIPLLIES
jgi:hypothetical protein